MPVLGAAILLAVLSMGMVGMFVLLPIACIQWTWNSVMTHMPVLPTIGVWQAALLYVAFATMLYLAGIVRIEIKAEKFH